MSGPKHDAPPGPGARAAFAGAAGAAQGEYAVYRWSLRDDRLEWILPPREGGELAALRGVESGAALTGEPDVLGERLDWIASADTGETRTFAGFRSPLTGEMLLEDHVYLISGAPAHAAIGLVQRHTASVIDLPELIESPDFASDEARACIDVEIDNAVELRLVYGPDAFAEICDTINRRLTAAAPGLGLAAAAGPGFFRALSRSGVASELHLLARSLQSAAGASWLETGAGPAVATVSIGVAYTPEDAPDPAKLAELATEALELARAQGPEGVRLTEHAAGGIGGWCGAARVTLGALREDRLTIAFQPVVRADKTDMVAFYECLARLHDGDGGVLPAREFMPAAEHLGLVRMIDRKVLQLALDALREAQSVRLSINLSPQTLRDAEWRRILEDAAAEDDGLPERLIIEITETSAIRDAGTTVEFIESLRGLGCAFALDDFGAGATSFGQLRDFRFDMVKIDGGFIRDIARNRDHRRLVESLVEISRHFEMMTVAEFVEDAACADALRRLGVDAFQGHHFGKPVLEPDWRACWPRIVAQAG